jgi:ketosteroid isomerase-like protein
MATDVDRTSETSRFVRDYFDALRRGEADAPRRFYAPDGRAHIHGVVGPAGRDEIAGFFAAWPGHARPLTGDVRGQLERAADTT